MPGKPAPPKKPPKRKAEKSTSEHTLIIEHWTKEYGNKFTVEDLVSLGRYQIINKITVDGILSQPFPARTLSLAKSSNKNKNKVIQVSRERYAKKKS